MTTVIAASTKEDDARLSRIASALPGACVAKYDARGLGGAIAIAQAVPYFTAVFTQQKPSLVIIIGDEPEMLAAALAALFMKVNVTHLGGDHEELGDFGIITRDCIVQIARASWHHEELASKP